MNFKIRGFNPRILVLHYKFKLLHNTKKHRFLINSFLELYLS